MPPFSRCSGRLQRTLLIIATVAGLLLSGCANAVSSSPAPQAPVRYGYRVIAVYPHDAGAYTEGLAFADGCLYEGTGLKGHSSLRKVSLESGEILQSSMLPAIYFGEGVTVFDGKIIQLTWESGAGFVYDKASFDLIRQFSYPTEGWGLTNDGKRLIMSDGTASLYFLDPDTFERTGLLEVRDGEGPVTGLNELEYVNGKIFANIWQTDGIAVIDAESGRLTGRIDLTGIIDIPEYKKRVDVPNGIAYDDKSGRLFVTGKEWPELFEIELVEKE